MRDVIEHLADPRKIMLELNRIMKPEAMLVLDTHNIDSLINAIVREKHTVVFGFEHPNHWAPKSITALLSRTGFNVITIHFRSIDFTIYQILSYFIAPTFTTILPLTSNVAASAIFRLLRAPFSILPLKFLDSKITPCIAQAQKRGSTMQVFAVKNSMPAPKTGAC
jgi:hypothetical protein